MILKGAQRAGGRQLAAHLLNDRDNDHVTVFELRGFVASDLHGAFQEAQAVSRGTKCQQYLFSLSLNPPKEAVALEADFRAAADAAEKKLGLDGQPRAIVIHEKEGRRHAHVVWSRIDADAMRAVNLSHFKRKLTDLSRDLYLTHEWSLPEGLRVGGGKSPLNFTLAEWQQAKRHGIDPREMKQAACEAWAQTQTPAALSAQLEARGLFLAQGDRRAVVVVDIDGGVHALARLAGVKTKEVRDQAVGSAGPDRIARTTYTAAGEVATVTTAYGTTEASIETVTYTSNGLTATVADAKGNMTAYVYDGFDRPSRTCFQSMSSANCAGSPADYEQLGYDANGNVTTRRLRDG